MNAPPHLPPSYEITAADHCGEVSLGHPDDAWLIAQQAHELSCVSASRMAAAPAVIARTTASTGAAHPDDRWFDETTAVTTEPSTGLHSDESWFDASVVVAADRDPRHSAAVTATPGWIWHRIADRYSSPPSCPVALDPAARTAAMLLDAAEIAPARRRRALEPALMELARSFPHPTSAEAMRRLVTGGTTLDDLVAAGQLRLAWRDRTDLHLRRHWSPLERAYVVDRGAPAMLGWATAARLVDDADLESALELLAEVWCQRWIRLPRGAAAFFSYPAFIDERARAVRSIGYALEDVGDDDVHWWSAVINPRQPTRIGWR